MKFYAIKGENATFIVDSWDEAQIKIKECIKPKYKSFNSLEEAEAFISGEVIKNEINGPVAYIDGSYNDRNILLIKNMRLMNIQILEMFQEKLKEQALLSSML